MKVLTLTETQDVARTAASGSPCDSEENGLHRQGTCVGFLVVPSCCGAASESPALTRGGSAEPVLKALRTTRSGRFSVKRTLAFRLLESDDSRSLNWLMSVDSAQVRLLASWLRWFTGRKGLRCPFVSRVGVHLRPRGREAESGRRRLGLCSREGRHHVLALPQAGLSASGRSPASGLERRPDVRPWWARERSGPLMAAPASGLALGGGCCHWAARHPSIRR